MSPPANRAPASQAFAYSTRWQYLDDVSHQLIFATHENSVQRKFVMEVIQINCTATSEQDTSSGSLSSTAPRRSQTGRSPGQGMQQQTPGKPTKGVQQAGNLAWPLVAMLPAKTPKHGRTAPHERAAALGTPSACPRQLHLLHVGTQSSPHYNACRCKITEKRTARRVRSPRERCSQAMPRSTRGARKRAAAARGALVTWLPAQTSPITPGRGGDQ